MNDILNFQTLENILKKAKRVLKHIKGTHILLSAFKKKQNENLGKNRATTLELPSRTVWNGIVIMFESLKDESSPFKKLL